MGKFRRKIDKAIWKVKLFGLKHPFIRDSAKAIGLGCITGFVIRHFLAKGMNEIYPEIIRKGGSEYKKAISEKVPEAFELIQEKYPDGMLIEVPEATCSPLLGKIKFKD